MRAPGRFRRLAAASLVAALVTSSLTIAAPAAAGGVSTACSTALSLPVRGLAMYSSPYGRFIDGIIANETTITAACAWVRVGWVENPLRTDMAWPELGTLDPGQTTPFHFSWPCDVPASWTPVVEGFAEPGAAAARIPLTVTAPSGPVVDAVTGMRTWSVTLTNAGTVPVSSIDAIGVERVGGVFLDALFGGCAPDVLAPGASCSVELHGKAATSTVPVAEVVAYALEAPTVTLTAATLTPQTGQPVALTIELRRADGTLITGPRTLKIYASKDGGCTWEYTYFHTETGVVSAALIPAGTTQYKARFFSDSEYGSALSEIVTVTPVGAAVAPEAPAVVKRSRAFSVAGCLPPAGPAPSPYVTVQCQRKTGARWALRSSTRTVPDAAGRYVKRVALRQKGTWRVQGHRGGVGYSNFAYVRVK